MVATTMKTGVLRHMLSPAFLIPVAASELWGSKDSRDKAQTRCTGETCDGSDSRLQWALLVTFLMVGAAYYRMKKAKDCAQTRELRATPETKQETKESQTVPPPSPLVSEDGIASMDSKRVDVTTVKSLLAEYAKANKEKKDIITNLNEKIHQLEMELKDTKERLDQATTER